MKKEKPHIHRDDLYVFGIGCGRTWFCTSELGWGAGDSPRKAYEEWKRDYPKTFFGRFTRRLLNKVFP